MKSTRLVHPSHARTVLSEDDAARLRASGWLEFEEARPVSKTAAVQRRYRIRCRELGYKRFTAYMPPELFKELIALKHPSETNSQFLFRLLELVRLL